MQITYTNKLRTNFFFYGVVPTPVIRSTLGRIIDAEKNSLRQNSNSVSPLEREMVAEIAGVTLAIRTDGDQVLHPDYSASYADLVNRLAEIKPNHPFKTRGNPAIEEYLSFLLSMTTNAHSWFERYTTGNAGQVILETADQTRFTIGALRH